MVITSHICRGNYHSTFFSSGAYDGVADLLFGEEQVNAYYLEYDDERSGGFAPLAKVTGDKKVVLGLITVIIGGVFNIFFDKLTGGSGIAGAAISSVGGNAVATPALALADKSLEATAAIATPQVAAAVVVTAILCPFMTSWISKHTGKEVKTTFSQVEEKVAEENATY